MLGAIQGLLSANLISAIETKDLLSRVQNLLYRDRRLFIVIREIRSLNHDLSLACRVLLFWIRKMLFASAGSDL